MELIKCPSMGFKEYSENKQLDSTRELFTAIGFYNNNFTIHKYLHKFDLKSKHDLDYIRCGYQNKVKTKFVVLMELGKKNFVQS